ncbi:IS3 family transposase [Streptomyces microflavus]|uniref:IS3 family transposase n=1 Tax=Streptomyces microflavus TaxID=1919 RepID=UPI003699C82C
MLYRLIHSEKANYPIVLLCRVLHVARSSYYAWREGESTRQEGRAADDALAHEITVLRIASRRTYGVPRIHAELWRLGHRVSRRLASCIASSPHAHSARGLAVARWTERFRRVTCSP